MGGPKQWVLGAVATGVLALPLGAAAAPARACENEDARTLTAAQGRAAVLCLINAERADRGLRELRRSVRLRFAATMHARDLVRRGYFDHTSSDGRTAFDRIRTAGYLRRVVRWEIGEALGFGTGENGTPRKLVTDLLGSPGHREIVLDPDFTDVGIGFVPRPWMQGDDPGATVVVDAGVVERAKRR